MPRNPDKERRYDRRAEDDPERRLRKIRPYVGSSESTDLSGIGLRYTRPVKRRPPGKREYPEADETDHRNER
jgi:hypothetical protein